MLAAACWRLQGGMLLLPAACPRVFWHQTTPAHPSLPCFLPPSPPHSCIRSVETTPPPPAGNATTAATTGPYNVTVLVGANTTVPVSGALSTCGVATCTYAWVLACPAPATPQSFSGVAPTITAGPGANIDTTGANGSVTCQLTLTVTDGNGTSNSTATSVAVKCVQRCVQVQASMPDCVCMHVLTRYPPFIHHSFVVTLPPPEPEVVTSGAEIGFAVAPEACSSAPCIYSCEPGQGSTPEGLGGSMNASHAQAACSGVLQQLWCKQAARVKWHPPPLLPRARDRHRDAAAGAYRAAPPAGHIPQPD